MGILAKQYYDLYFTEAVYFNFIVQNCIDLMKNEIIPEFFYWKCRYLILNFVKNQRWLKSQLNKYSHIFRNLRNRAKIRTRILELIKKN